MLLHLLKREFSHSSHNVLVNLLDNEIRFIHHSHIRDAAKLSTAAKRTGYNESITSKEDHTLFHGRYEDDFLFKHYDLRLRSYDKLSESHKNEQVESILASLNKKSTTEKHDNTHLNKLITKLDHLSINSLLYNCIQTEIELPRQVKFHINDTLKFHLHKNRPNTDECDSWFYSANLLYQTLPGASIYDNLIFALSNSNRILLSDDQFYHLLFLMVCRRKHHDVLQSKRTQIIRLLDSSNFIETATVSSAYFKTKSRITDSLIIEKLISSTLRNRDQINFMEPGFCSIVKSIRYSRLYECRRYVLSLLNTLIDENIDILGSSLNKVHVLKLMEVYRIYDIKFLNKISTLMFSNLEEYRIKDIQYILTSISNFAHFSDNLKDNLSKLVSEIISEKRPDTSKQFYHLMPILRSFAIFEYYNDNFITYINKKMKSEPQIVQRMREVLEFDRSALLLYVASRLEGKKVHFSPSPSLLDQMSSTIDRSIETASDFDSNFSIEHLASVVKDQPYYAITKSILEIALQLRDCKELDDPKYKLYCQYTFPHQNYTDLIITTANEEVGPFDQNSYMPKFVPRNQKHVMVVAIQKFDYVDGEQRLSGYKQLTLRLLKKLGYNIVTVELGNYDISALAKRIKLTFDHSG